MPHPPLALVGAACRLPGGVADLPGFAAHVRAGVDVITRAPAWRGFDATYDPRPGAVGRSCQIEGAWLDEIRDVDATAFGLNPREATALDPQQRLLLEVAREALEHAGRPAEGLPRGRTGIWVGISGSDFRSLVQRRPAEAIDAWVATGTHPGVAAGRLAYVLGTTGPAISVDTACSSGLVALHEACRALWDGEVDAALVAGVHVLLDPLASVTMSAVGTLSPTSRCRAYSEAADGYVRGEGCVALLLVREPAPTDRVLGWVEGTASNHGGRTNGLAAPSPGAQRDLIRAALADAGARPEDIGYHEGHGSATRLGDAVELGALLEVHAGRERPLPVGTLKATMGHMEAASGLAGLLRALIIGQDGRIPPQPHATPPAAALRPPLVVGEGVVEGPRVAVSSFGIGGSNAHVVLRPAEVTAPATHASGPLPLLLSAHGEEALRAHATRVAEALPTLPWPDACGTAARGRSAGPWRLTVVGRSAEEAAKGLAGAAPREALELPRVAWLFPGQGPGLARGLGLADRHVAARDAFDEVFATADPLIGASLRDAIAAGTTDVGLLQVGVFAVSMALARTLLALGEPPVAVAGHSSGEVAAACVAGVLSLEDAVRLLVARGEVLRRSAPGGMAAVIGPAELVTLPEGPVGIAAVNHDGETVISGPTDALAEAVADLRARGLVVKPVDYGRAGHSVLVEPHLDVLREVVAGLTFRPPTIEVVSAVTGEIAGAELLDPEAWVRQMRVPVRFAGALATLGARGIDAFVELGPHPVLTAAVGAALPGARAIRSLHRDEDEGTSLARLVGELWCAGAELDPGALLPEHRTVDLPLTPFHRQRLWPEGLGAAPPSTRWRLVIEPLPLPEPAPPPEGRVLEVPDGCSPEEATAWAARELGALAAEAAPPRVWLVLPDEPLAATAVAGVARCAALEVPALGVTALPRTDAATRDRLRLLPRGIVVVRHGDGFGTERWLPAPDAPPSPLALGGTWVVTGGFGAVGGHVAGLLESRGARVLRVGRHPGPGGLRADVAVAEDVERVLAEAGPELEGVFHAAVALKDQPIHAIDRASVDEVFAAKVGGALHLERLLADRPDVRLVLCGAAAGSLGAPGQGAYAAANAALKAVGERRRAAGGRAVTFVSGPWGGSGLALPTEDARRARGIPPMAPASVLAAMEVGLAGPDVDFAVLDATPERPSHPVLDGPGAVEHRLPADPDHAVDGRAVMAGADQLIAVARMLDLPALEAIRYPRVVVAERSSLAVRAVARERELTLVVDGVDALVARRAEPESPSADLDAARAACPQPHDVDAMLARFEQHGLRIGPSRRVLARAWAGTDRWLAELADGGTEGARLDACLWLGGQGLWSRAIPTGFERVTLPASMDAVRWASVARRPVVGELARIDVDLFDVDGRPCGRLTGHTLMRATEARGLDPSAGVEAAATWVAARAAALLGRDPASLTPDTELTDVGFDSMMGVELRNQLTAEGVAVPLHVVVGAATPRQIAQAFAAAAAPAPAPSAGAPAPTEAGPALPATEELSPLATHLSAALVGAVGGAVLLALSEWLLG